jgi:hypothetical protein
MKQLGRQGVVLLEKEIEYSDLRMVAVDFEYSRVQNPGEASVVILVDMVMLSVRAGHPVEEPAKAHNQVDWSDHYTAVGAVDWKRLPEDSL